MDNMLRVGQVAARLGVAAQTVRRYADDGRLAVCVLPSGHRRFRVEDIDRLVSTLKEAS